MKFITAKIDGTRMLNVTGTNDWGRLNHGGYNTEADMLIYRTLVTTGVVLLPPGLMTRIFYQRGVLWQKLYETL